MTHDDAGQKIPPISHDKQKELFSSAHFNTNN